MTDDPEARAIAEALTPAQMAALLWLHDTPHWRARVIPEPPAKPRKLLIDGDGKTTIAVADWKAIKSLIEASADEDRIWSLTPLGLRVRAVLEQEAARDE